jgi:cation diffusion facilitator CzcD-associated flavoprotein CzcO
MSAATVRTRVAIIGAGPAGLVLGNLLLESRIDCIMFTDAVPWNGTAAFIA